ncbi:Cof-type HAD-IIB family hydrolase [Erysipelothrix urinaevulpis]|uniref:Cof-type HAD-IIB family hydrolase n=1 Tax=Erysipelothrix urinaevulpis TaxID=2683717 RepID=UPI0022A731E6|nr:Cof-type HAD-IIB family hydrolase [Erysipelothrix urinaevulpis]
MKVFVTDLDGTLLDAKGKLHPDMKELIKVIRSKGFLFGVATGRPLFSAKAAIPDAEEIFDFLICNNGGEIYDFVGRQYHQQYPLTKDVMNEIIEDNLKLGANPILYINDQMVTAFEDVYNQRVRTFLDVVYEEDIYSVVPETLPKIIFSVTPELGKDVISFHKEKANARYNAFKSQNELVEFMDPRVNKEVGLEWFCQQHNIDLSEVMSFGDNDNDYELVRAAGVGVAMNNATDYVKSVADHVAKSNDEQGVYHFLMDYLSN